jgi:hypothetical protein
MMFWIDMGHRMTEPITKDTYATLVDLQGRFVDSLGLVADAGRVLKIIDGIRTEYYDQRLLSDAVQSVGLKLIFLPPNKRLPSAPIQISEAVYARTANARLSLNLDRDGT